MRLLPPLLLTPLLAQAIPAPTEQLRFGQAPRAPIPVDAGLATKPLLSADFAEWATELLAVWAVPGAAVGVIKVDPETGGVQTEFVNVGTAGRGREMSEDVSAASQSDAPP